MMSTKIRSGAWSGDLGEGVETVPASTTWQPACARNISALRRMVLLSSMTMTLMPRFTISLRVLPMS